MNFLWSQNFQQSAPHNGGIPTMLVTELARSLDQVQPSPPFFPEFPFIVNLNSMKQRPQWSFPLDFQLSNQQYFFFFCDVCSLPCKERLKLPLWLTTILTDSGKISLLCCALPCPWHRSKSYKAFHLPLCSVFRSAALLYACTIAQVALHKSLSQMQKHAQSSHIFHLQEA